MELLLILIQHSYFDTTLLDSSRERPTCVKAYVLLCPTVS
jgi:hypothetical protein